MHLDVENFVVLIKILFVSKNCLTPGLSFTWYMPRADHIVNTSSNPYCFVWCEKYGYRVSLVQGTCCISPIRVVVVTVGCGINIFAMYVSNNST